MDQETLTPQNCLPLLEKDPRPGNKVLNPFIPFGDCSLIRRANLHANICHVGSKADVRQRFNMVGSRSARPLNMKDYGLAPGKSADPVVIDSTTPEVAVAELVPVLHAFKRGRRSLTRIPAVLHAPR